MLACWHAGTQDMHNSFRIFSMNVAGYGSPRRRRVRPENWSMYEVSCGTRALRVSAGPRVAGNLLMSKDAAHRDAYSERRLLSWN